MTDRAYIVSRALEHKIAIAVNNDQNTMLVTLDVLKEIFVVLKEQEAAYQGAVELLQQKTILFDDAIKRLKEQEAEIRQLKLALDIAKGTCKGIIAEDR